MRGEDVRTSNASLALQTILAAPGQHSRASLATHIGATRATTSRLVDELLARGLLNQQVQHTLGPGRPATLLTPRSGVVYAMGLEINVSAMRAMAIDLTGHTLASEVAVVDSASVTPDSAMARLNEIVSYVAEQAEQSAYLLGATQAPRCIGAGLALPGLVGQEALTVAPNLGWHDVPLNYFSSHLRVTPLRLVGNEADLAAYAVAWPAPGVRGETGTFMHISGEVGIGAGIVMDYRPLRGEHGWAGEIGHLCVDPTGPTCKCGARGCLEAYLGMRSLAQHAGLPEPPSLDQLVSAARAGEGRVIEALAEGGLALGRALAAVTNLLDLPAFTLGGNLAELATWLLPQARNELAARIPHDARPAPRLECLSYSAPLACRGAAHRVFRGLIANPLVDAA